MRRQLLEKLRSEGFLVISSRKGIKVHLLKTPCTIRLGADVLQYIEENCPVDEEAGGVLWAEPVRVGEDTVYNITAVRLVRNACEDTPREDGRTRKDTYRANDDEIKAAQKECLDRGCLPVFFHTHPADEEKILTEFSAHDLYTETSWRDQETAEKRYYWAGDERLFLPECLIVVNSTPTGDPFIGFFNGSIAPVTFAASKKRLTTTNLTSIKQKVKSASPPALTKRQEWMLVAAVVVALAIIIYYRKHMVPALFSALPLIFAFLARTGRESSAYCNYGSNGDVSIEIPDRAEGNF